MLALVNVCLGDGIPRWDAGICECLSRRRSAEMGLRTEIGGWHW